MPYLYIAAMLFCTATGQLLIKKGSNSVNNNKVSANRVKLYLNKHLVSGVLITLLAPLFYFMALQFLELSTAFALSSLNYVIIMFLSALIFQEKLSREKIWGTVCIMIGVIFFNLQL